MTHVSFGSQCGGEPGGASESSEVVWGFAPCARAGAVKEKNANVSTTHRMARNLLLQEDAQRAGVGEQRLLERLVVHRGGGVVEREQVAVDQPAVHLADLRRRREVLERVATEGHDQLRPDDLDL